MLQALSGSTYILTEALQTQVHKSCKPHVGKITASYFTSFEIFTAIELRIPFLWDMTMSQWLIRS